MHRSVLLICSPYLVPSGGLKVWCRSVCLPASVSPCVSVWHSVSMCVCVHVCVCAWSASLSPHGHLTCLFQHFQTRQLVADFRQCHKRPSVHAFFLPGRSVPSNAPCAWSLGTRERTHPPTCSAVHSDNADAGASHPPFDISAALCAPAAIFGAASPHLSPLYRCLQHSSVNTRVLPLYNL